MFSEMVKDRKIKYQLQCENQLRHLKPPKNKLNIDSIKKGRFLHDQN